MSFDYPASKRVGRNTVIRSETFNTRMTEIANAFSVLPSLDQINNAANSYGVVTGTADNLLVDMDPVPTQYLDGQRVRFTTLAENTGPMTINLNGLGARPLKN
ncbi:MAG: hypothetical protein AAFQ51_19675, partial [Pseudomonadota bacterium]